MCVCVCKINLFGIWACVFIKEYEAAEKCVNRVLHMEPHNYQAKQLKTLINKKIKKGAVANFVGLLI